jgi:hypothetical protein
VVEAFSLVNITVQHMDSRPPVGASWRAYLCSRSSCTAWDQPTPRRRRWCKPCLWLATTLPQTTTACYPTTSRQVDDHALLRRAAEIHTKAPIAGTDWIDEFGTNISSSSSVPFYKTGFGLFGKTRGNDDSVWVDVLKNKLTGPTVINLGHNMNWGPLSVNILERGTSKGVSHLPARRAGTSVRVKPLMPT